MTNSEYPKQPPTPEQVRSAEQEPKNNTSDLLLYAEFQATNTFNELLKTNKKENEARVVRLEKQFDAQQRVKKILENLQRAGKNTLIQAVAEIDKQSSFLDKSIATENDPDKMDELEEARDDYSRTKTLIEAHQNKDIYELGGFSNWLKERNARLKEENLKKQQQEEVARREQTAQQIEGVYKKLGVESESEREKSRERAMEIVLADAGVNINMSVKQEMSNAAYQTGYQNLTTRINAEPRMIPAHTAVTKIENQLLASNDLMRGKKGDDVIKEHGIREIIDIRHLTKQVTEVVAQAKKGFLGFGSKKAETKYRQEPVLHNEKVVNGEREPAVQITYYIPSQRDWVDYSNRSSGMLAEIILPESKAEELSRILERDPSAMRQIVERVMKEKILANPATWEAPQFEEDENSSLRPPYEKWDAESNGGNIYLQKESMAPGFHEEALKEVKE